MAGCAGSLAVASLLIGLMSVSSRAADDESRRYSARNRPRTVDQVLLQANVRDNSKKTRLGDNTITDGLDMVLTEKQYTRLFGKGPEARMQRYEKIIDTWPNGVIPYEIADGHFTPEKLKKINEAMTTWQTLTCVTFRPATSYDNYRVVIESGEGCWSMLGKHPRQPQRLSLSAGSCFYEGTVEHEFGHAIGLVHEHQRPERDDHLAVYENNVIPTYRDQLEIYNPGSVHKMGLDYDYYSVMHYGKSAFSFDGFSTTLMAYNRRTQQYFPKITEDLGKVIGPSFTDVKLVNLMYNCGASCGAGPACGADCFVDKHCRCVCKEDMPAVPCDNYLADCDSRALDGECQAYLPYMEFFCRKACKMCPDTGNMPLKVPGVVPRCEDKRWDCQGLASRGDCDTYYESMMLDCYKTCTGCPPAPSNNGGAPAVSETTPDSGTTGCQDDDVLCAGWAEAQYCVTYPHIIPTCKKSCGACS